MTRPSPAGGPVIWQVAVPSPLRQAFDYLPPAPWTGPPPAPGVRVEVPFGPGRRVGILTAVAGATTVPDHRLRQASRVLDDAPLWPRPLFELLRWAADYYHHPPGEVFASALPAALRQGRPASPRPAEVWRLTAAGHAGAAAVPARAAAQRRLLAVLAAAPQGLPPPELAAAMDGWRAPARALEAKGLVETVVPPPLTRPPPPPAVAPSTPQREVLERLAGLEGFAAVLLDGVTGSGKTEVYLRHIEHLRDAGAQALVLVPEIGLTPQMAERFRERFGAAVVVMHSRLTDHERLAAWAAAREGRAAVVLGTRSAVFTPLARPGVIVVDEEHDGSYKQQEGFRYSARDLAVARARREGIPVILGSATPSLETLENAAAGRYQHHVLPHRVTGHAPPRLRVVDVRGRPLAEGLSQELLAAVAARIARGEQSLLFLNRRGWAPVLLCHECGWVSHCDHCDARLVFHRSSGRQHCHYCGAVAPMPEHCPECRSTELRFLGKGTERIEEALRGPFPEARIVRVDRDSTRRKGALEDALAEVHSGRADILIGTQMVAKGHHFPAVTLVGILDADGGLCAVDYRAPERLAQLIVQVAGRAGRGDTAGEVMVQTHQPEHPLLQALAAGGYGAAVPILRGERRAAELPPFCAMALVRAEARQEEHVVAFLEGAVAVARARPVTGAEVHGPIPAPVERVANRRRFQLVILAAGRLALHQALTQWLPAIEALPGVRRVRWSVDVDPQDLG
ncbi:MAG: primosomal protein N' [Gammaproteobacteria bacterium]|nr:primosomal protein N' [Gammaproteobacteria bacterium]